jgi:hypothetical protein
MIYLTTLFSCIGCTSHKAIVNDLGKMQKEMVVTFFKLFSQHLLGETEPSLGKYQSK